MKSFSLRKTSLGVKGLISAGVICTTILSASSASAIVYTVGIEVNANQVIAFDEESLQPVTDLNTDSLTQCVG